MNQVIHQAVRRDLERLELALADFPDGDHQRRTCIARTATCATSSRITTSRRTG